jgi:hypothetical protein
MQPMGSLPSSLYSSSSSTGGLTKSQTNSWQDPREIFLNSKFYPQTPYHFKTKTIFEIWFYKVIKDLQYVII